MFEKNLEAIDNLALKRRLAKISPVESRMGVSYCVTPSGDYVLLKDEAPSDDLNNPREAVRKMLSTNIKSVMKSNDIIITFGIGLGYLLDETFNSYPARIYVYEPDLNLLHFVLSNVDISEHLASGRVFITNDIDELITKLSSTYLTKDKVEIVYLQNYAIIKNKELLVLTQKVLDSCKSKMVDVNTITKFSKKWFLNIVTNIASINNGQMYLLSDLEHKFIGQTALIVAAGPSLNDNIAKIQANRNNFVVIAVNKVVKYLVQNGIIPDFVVCLDAQYVGKTLDGLESHLSRSNCITDIRSDASLTQKGFNKVFYNFTDTDAFLKKLADYNDFIKFGETGGTAASFALVAAVKMGFSKIVLTGLDLAFKDNLIYSTGETMNRVSQDQIAIGHVKHNLVQVDSVEGGKVYTREDYATFVHHFETLIKELNYSEIYNTTTFGAKITGVKNVSWDDLQFFNQATMQHLAFIQPFKLDVKQFVDDEFCQINNVISFLSKGIFSPALVSAIIKSVFIYQYMQADILEVLQRNFEPQMAESFIEKTKTSIKVIVETLQNNQMI